MGLPLHHLSVELPSGSVRSRTARYWSKGTPRYSHCLTSCLETDYEVVYPSSSRTYSSSKSADASIEVSTYGYDWYSGEISVGCAKPGQALYIKCVIRGISSLSGVPLDTRSIFRSQPGIMMRNRRIGSATLGRESQCFLPFIPCSFATMTTTSASADFLDKIAELN